MKLVILYGPPGVGKLTVGRELAALTGFKLFHNHLTVDLAAAVFDFKSRPFIDLRDRIWLLVFDRAIEAGVEGMILRSPPSERCERTLSRMSSIASSVPAARLTRSTSTAVSKSYSGGFRSHLAPTSCNHRSIYANG